MEVYQCTNCYKRLNPTEVITVDDGIYCNKCAIQKVIRPEPDNICQRCGRCFYNHEVVEIEVGTVCTACLCEEIYLMLKDIKRRLEAAEEDIASLFKSL